MSEQIQRYDMDGNKISLRNLCIQEPDWAVNRILHLELSHPTNDAKKMLLGERVAELACAELDKEYAYKMFSHFKGSGEPVEKQVTALEYFQNEAFEEIRKQSSKSNEQEGVKDDK